jgi:hypothetical protein
MKGFDILHDDLYVDNETWTDYDSSVDLLADCEGDA